MSDSDRQGDASRPERLPVPDAQPAAGTTRAETKKPREFGGPAGPEPTRYGDWEVGGRCTDF